MLRTLPDESVHCGVTSPPYYGLRDYGTAAWDGGDAECDHRQDRSIGIDSSTLGGGKKTTNPQQEGYRTQCPKCGAVRIDKQIGLEDTPEAYVQRLVEVFREFRRVLRADGTCWLNLGDSYARNGGTDKQQSKTAQVGGTLNSMIQMPNRDQSVPSGLKEKDLIGIPWRLAFALQADGWYLRSDVIWHKPNPMPESVTDRPTKAHEYLFLLTRSARYFYDAEAIKEPSVDPIGSAKRYEYGFTGRPDVKITPNDDKGHRYAPQGDRVFSPTRNKRSVWTIATEPTGFAHFATMPTALVGEGTLQPLAESVAAIRTDSRRSAVARRSRSLEIFFCASLNSLKCASSID